MEKYVAVILCGAKTRLAIPCKWYGQLDCQGYNRDINKNVKRRIFFSPFGDDVEANFDLPTHTQLQRNANSCYEVYFLQIHDTKEQCLDYLLSRRAVHPAVYNQQRQRERIPNPHSPDDVLPLPVNENEENADHINPNEADQNLIGEIQMVEVIASVSAQNPIASTSTAALVRDVANVNVNEANSIDGAVQIESSFKTKFVEPATFSIASTSAAALARERELVANVNVDDVDSVIDLTNVDEADDAEEPPEEPFVPWNTARVKADIKAERYEIF